MGIFIGILEEGLIYSILALGVLITYRVLDFPDLTVDSSFPLGAAVTAILTVKGVNPALTLLAAMLAGAAAGLVTGLIHVKCRVRDLLSGIITMTGLYSINLRIAGRANLPFFNMDTIFDNAFVDSFPAFLQPSASCEISAISRPCLKKQGRAEGIPVGRQSLPQGEPFPATFPFVGKSRPCGAKTNKKL